MKARYLIVLLIGGMLALGIRASAQESFFFNDFPGPTATPTSTLIVTPTPTPTPTPTSTATATSTPTPTATATPTPTATPTATPVANTYGVHMGARPGMKIGY